MTIRAWADVTRANVTSLRFGAQKEGALHESLFTGFVRAHYCHSRVVRGNCNRVGNPARFEAGESRRIPHLDRSVAKVVAVDNRIGSPPDRFGHVPGGGILAF